MKTMPMSRMHWRRKYHDMNFSIVAHSSPGKCPSKQEKCVGMFSNPFLYKAVEEWPMKSKKQLAYTLQQETWTCSSYQVCFSKKDGGNGRKYILSKESEVVAAGDTRVLFQVVFFATFIPSKTCHSGFNQKIIG